MVSKLRQYNRPPLRAMLFAWVFGMLPYMISCVDKGEGSIPLARTPRPSFVALQAQIHEMDSLYEAASLERVEHMLDQLLESKMEWVADLDAREYAWVYDWIGEFHLRVGDLDAAKRYTELAVSRLDSIQDIDFKTHVLNNLAIIESDLGNSNRAITLLFESMDMYGADTVNSSFINFYNNIGGIYRINQQYDLAIQYFEKLMVLAENLGLEEEYGFYHGNLGYTYLLMGQRERSIAHLKQAQAYFATHGQVEEELALNALLASGHIALGELARAEQFLQGNLQEAQSRKLWAIYVETTISLFELYAAQGAAQLAFEVIAQGLEKIHITNTARLQLKIYEKLIDYYREVGDFEHAFAYMQRRNDVQDSISDAARIALMRELTVKYETDRKLDQIAQLEVLHEKEQRINTIYLLGLAVLVLVLAFIFLLLRRISAQKQALEASNQTKDKLFSIIAHDLRSPMIALQGMGNLMNYYIGKSDERKLLDLGNKTGQALGRINHLLDNLLNWAVSNSKQITYRPVSKDVAEWVEEAAALHQIAAEAKEIHWEIALQPASVFVDLNMASSVLRNILSNAIKHAPTGSTIAITGIVLQEHYELSIQDEGGGIPQHVIDRLEQPGETLVTGGGKESFGLGLRLAKSFIGKHGGKLAISNVGSGTCIAISLPLKQKIQ